MLCDVSVPLEFKVILGHIYQISWNAFSNCGTKALFIQNEFIEIDDINGEVMENRSMNEITLLHLCCAAWHSGLCPFFQCTI